MNIYKTEIGEYNEFMDQYEDYIYYEEDIDPFYRYGPLTNQYWSCNPRILVCNLEPYGEAEGIIDFNIDIFVNDWMKKIKGYNANTPRYTAKFIYGLLTSISGGVTKKVDFANIDEVDLKKSMEKIAYLNFRVDQNTGQSKNAEYGKIREQFENVTKNYFKGQICKLNPQIIIVSSKLGCELFNFCFKDCNLYFHSVKKWDDKVICSINHFSRVKYDNFSESINKIISALMTLPSSNKY
jgi:hypothetical protein